MKRSYEHFQAYDYERYGAESVVIDTKLVFPFKRTLFGDEDANFQRMYLKTTYPDCKEYIDISNRSDPTLKATKIVMKDDSDIYLCQNDSYNPNYTQMVCGVTDDGDVRKVTFYDQKPIPESFFTTVLNHLPVVDNCLYNAMYFEMEEEQACS